MAFIFGPTKTEKWLKEKKTKRRKKGDWKRGWELERELERLRD